MIHQVTPHLPYLILCNCLPFWSNVTKIFQRIIMKIQSSHSACLLNTHQHFMRVCSVLWAMTVCNFSNYHIWSDCPLCRIIVRVSSSNQECEEHIFLTSQSLYKPNTVFLNIFFRRLANGVNSSPGFLYCRVSLISLM